MNTLWGAVRPYAGRLVAAGLAGAAAELCGLGLVAAAAWLIARAAQQPQMAALTLAIVAVRAFAVGKGTLRYAERLAGHDVALRALAELRGRVFDALARTPHPPGNRAGDALTRLVADVDAVQDLLLRCLLPTTAALACGTAGIAVCATAAPGTAPILAAGLALAGVALPLAAMAPAGRAAAQAAQARRVLAVRSLDVLEGADDLAVSGARDRFTAAASAASRRLTRAEKTAASVGAVVTGAGFAAQGLTTAAVTWAGLRTGAGEVAVAVAALTALVAMESALAMAGAALGLREVLPAARRVAALLHAPAAPRPPHPVPLPPGPLTLELHDLHLTYPATHGGPVTALDGVNLRVRPGARIAIVGASGAGKSTILAAASGQATPHAGNVRLGGREMASLAPATARLAVRGLSQDAHVFAGTLRDNLLLARPGASTPELEAAARRARLDEVIGDLPGGWDTRVGTGGHGLSGGQRQRLLLARALLAAPPVLILDEPAEALDPATADAIVRDILTGPGDGTVLLVTHRLGPLEHAQEVVVLDRGRVVQRGPHHTLLTRPGPYRDLWESEQLTANHT